MRTLQSVLNGKWKILILWYLHAFEVRRFGELRRHLGDITQSTLTKQLRELESDGFIERRVYQEIPPKVEYRLSGIGMSFAPVMEQMRSWSQTFLCPDAEKSGEL
ncbi:winged helix-turn-helix transcriptional regulator [Niveibacterium terrae]|uniref:winged helix-turn-helix transcriptional regulator n=1 Tax=Niveibacterium terrae TaxID=3373598 RepID=UPI003A8EB547